MALMSHNLVLHSHVKWLDFYYETTIKPFKASFPYLIMTVYSSLKLMDLVALI